MNLVPAKEFASTIGRSPRSISDTLYRGGDLPPPIRIGRRLYFSQPDIDNWLDEKREEAVTEMRQRQQAVTRPLDHTRPSISNRTKKSRGPRAGKQSGSSLNTAVSRGVSHG
jgi:predicted DNA-binding transcriptional regulator AlpA